MDFDARFKNWVRWCKAKGFHRSRVGSAEGNYRSGQVWEATEPRGEPFDELDALMVNRAFSELGGQVRRAIKVIYFREYWRPQWQAQKLGIRMVDLPRVGYEARIMLLNRVEFLERKRKILSTVKPVLSRLGEIFA